MYLVGSQYQRIPEGSTDRYTQWANNLTEEQLYTQVRTVCLKTISSDYRNRQGYFTVRNTETEISQKNSILLVYSLRITYRT